MRLVGMTYIDNLRLSDIIGIFKGIPFGKDNTILWQEIRQAHGKDWEEFLGDLHTRRYINNQNPHLTFLMSRFPVMWVWQIIQIMASLILKISLNPLIFLMMSQPSHDSVSFLLIRLSLHILITMPILSTVSYGAACIVKPTSLVILPFMVSKTPLFLLSLLLTVFYIAWLSTFQSGRNMLQFFSVMSYYHYFNGEQYSRHIQGRLIRFAARWKRYRGYEALLSLSLYLFPSYISYDWRQWAVLLLLCLLAPNIKYFILCEVFR